MSKDQVGIEEESILSLFSDQGRAKELIKGFESRAAQEQFLKATLSAFNKKQVLLAEAGTGTGKSLAYLIPAIVWAHVHQKLVVIATHTLNLQQQLLEKDIPLASKLLGIPIQAELAKGMQNYLCHKKLDQLQAQRSLGLSGGLNGGGDEEVDDKVLDYFHRWSRQSKEGSRLELKFAPRRELWEQLNADSENCQKSHCPHYDNCFFYKARAKLQGAHLVVANHHLLFSDLSLRALSEDFENDAILPAYQAVVVDEAHHLESVATTHFAKRLSAKQVVQVLNRYFASGQSKGRLERLSDLVWRYFNTPFEGDIKKAADLLQLSLPALKIELLKLLQGLFEGLEELKGMQAPNKSAWRLEEGFWKEVFWQQGPSKLYEAFKTSWHRLYLDLNTLLRCLENGLEDQECAPFFRGMLLEMKQGLRQIEAIELTLSAFVNPSKEGEPQVYWMEEGKEGLSLCVADLEVGPRLANSFFNHMDVSVVCSATLSVGKSLSFAKERLGLSPEQGLKKTLAETVLPPAFDYAKQSALLVPNDLPDPSDPQFTQKAAQAIYESIEASAGGCFVLFTSYHMLEQARRLLEPQLISRGYGLFVQGQKPRHHLLEAFKESKRAVLFGTDSFWEGVDVSGEQLRLVIIVKLPFRVPDEPLFEARQERLSQAGEDPFVKLAVPMAAVKFKQGFGRLIRSHKDRGCIICLDKRLITRHYGKLFLNSLPPCPLWSGKVLDLKQQIRKCLSRQKQG